MKTLKIIGISILQSFLFTLLAWFIIRSLIFLTDFAAESPRAMGIIGGADGPTAIFITSKTFTGNTMLLTFTVVWIMATISNLSALIPREILSRAILILCNLLLIIYCALFLNFGKVILLIIMIVGVIILTIGHIIIRSANE